MQLERLLTWKRPLVWNGTEREKFQPSYAVRTEEKGITGRERSKGERKDKGVEVEGKQSRTSLMGLNSNTNHCGFEKLSVKNHNPEDKQVHQSWC